MAGVKKPSAMSAFADNMNDAKQLVAYADAFGNSRAYRMRRELRERVGDALRIPKRQHGDLDCLESSHLFVTFKPGSRLGRADFVDRRPLLRQAIVAGCAALETYVADKTMELIGPVLRSDDIPARLAEVPLDVGELLAIQNQYTRYRWGLRKVVEQHVRRTASSAPSQIGLIVSLVGVKNWSRATDRTRKDPGCNTVEELERITARRNRVAHLGDRSGRGRAALSLEEVDNDLETITSIVEALEKVLNREAHTN